MTVPCLTDEGTMKIKSHEECLEAISLLELVSGMKDRSLLCIELKKRIAEWDNLQPQLDMPDDFEDFLNQNKEDLLA